VKYLLLIVSALFASQLFAQGGSAIGVTVGVAHYEGTLEATDGETLPFQLVVVKDEKRVGFRAGEGAPFCSIARQTGTMTCQTGTETPTVTAVAVSEPRPKAGAAQWQGAEGHAFRLQWEELPTVQGAKGRARVSYSIIDDFGGVDALKRTFSGILVTP
jgi:hypothetical protein